MEIYTIGFTKKTAEQFFGLLKSYGIGRLMDVRLRNISQLAGFAKRDDLAFFLREICGAAYLHEQSLAPTQVLLDSYRNNGTWGEYAAGFLALMADRQIENRLPKSLFDTPTALLCSEATAERCHRRLIAEYLRKTWGDVQITHL